MNLCKEYTEGAAISCPEDVNRYCSDFRKADREHFVVIGLNTRKNIIYKEIAFIGTLDSAVIHPREVFKRAIINSASAIITVHNHPSGGLTPSDEDQRIWEQLVQAGEILGIPVLDNLIVTQEEFYSQKG